LTQSFSADGQTPFTGIFKNADGNAAAPSYTFAADLTTGLYRIGTGDIGITLSGTQVASIAGSGTTWSGAWTFNGSLTIDSSTITLSAGAVTALLAGLALTFDVGAAFDGNGSVLTAKNIFVHIPCAMTINKWSIMADQSGSVTIDILRTNAGIPSASIVGSGTKPNLSSAQDSLDNAPASWTATTLAKDDWLEIEITGTPSSVTYLTFVLQCTRTGA
jgi:hypothetical protein